MRHLLFVSLTAAALLWGAAVCAQESDPDRDLLDAAAAGDLDRAQQALARGASPNATQGWRDLPAFQVACKSGNLRLVEYLVEKGADPNRDGVDALGDSAWYGSPLATAAGEGHLEIVRFLVERCGIDVDKPESPNRDGAPPGWTALTWAAQKGRTEVVDYLLSRGASVSVRDNAGQTPLHCAAAQGHVEAALLLLEKRSDVDAVDLRGRTPLHGAAAAGRGELVGRFLASGASPNRQDLWGDTPLHYAAAAGDPLGCGVLLSYKADPKTRDLRGLVPLHLAAGAGSEAACTALLIGGSEVDPRDGEGETPLFLAARRGLKGAVTLLMDAGADPKTRALNGTTALHAAAAAGHPTACALLLYRGAERDARTDLGHTPLHLASLEGKFDVARLLLVLGADPDLADDLGWTPLHFAAFANSLPTVQTLLSYGRPALDPVNGSGETPLLVACAAAGPETVASLLDAGAHVGVRNREGLGPLGFALRRWQGGLTELLLARGARFGPADQPAAATALFRMIMQWDEEDEELPALLAAGLDPHIRIYDGKTALHMAVEMSSESLARLLLQFGAEPEVADSQGDTALHRWAMRVEPEAGMLELLLHGGAEVDTRNGRGRTAFSLAAGHRDLSPALALLLEAGADPELPDVAGFTPLHYAASFGFLDTVEFLLARKVSTKALSLGGASALAMAVEADEKEVVERLRKAGASEAGVLDARLAHAAENGELEELRALLKEGASPDAKSGIDSTPVLVETVRFGDWEVVQRLLDAGADVNATDSYGCTALFYLSYRDDEATLRRWLALKPDINRANRTGETPLWVCASLGRPTALALLLERGADPNRANAQGVPPLFVALEPTPTSQEEGGVLRLLLRAGASPSVRDLDGETILHHLIRVEGSEEGLARTLRLLLDGGIDLDVQNGQGRTALHVAAANNNVLWVRILLAAGASPTARDREGLTPAGLALRHLYKPTFDLLRQWGRRRLGSAPTVSK